MEILLIRHADPDYRNDTITKQGHRQARLLSERLAGIHIDNIYVSPLGRAQATCKYVSDQKGMRPAVLPWLAEKEIARQAFSDCLWEAHGSVLLHSPQLPRYDDWYLDNGLMPEGRRQYELVSSSFDVLMRKHGYVREEHMYRVEQTSSQRIALFSHKGVILTLLSHVVLWPMPIVFSCLHISPTGLTRVVFEEHLEKAMPKMLAVNDLSHLGKQADVQ